MTVVIGKMAGVQGCGEVTLACVAQSLDRQALARSYSWLDAVNASNYSLRTSKPCTTAVHGW
jgi:hypothetical protein